MSAAGRIVVGVDGSESSKDALAWAAHQAELSGDRLEVVLAWHVPPAVYGAPLVPVGGYDFEGQARRTLEDTIHEALRGRPDVEISTVVVEGYAVPSLLQAAEGAHLLVVGSRGHGSFAGMLLGSVSAHCVAHAACPVVVVRHSARAA